MWKSRGFWRLFLLLSFLSAGTVAVASWWLIRQAEFLARHAAAVDEGAIAAQLTAMRWQAAVLSLTALALAVGITWWLARQITPPVRELAQAAADIAAGGFGRKAAVATADDEIGELADAFNDMSATLADRVSRLQADQQRLRAVFTSMVEGVVVIDDRERVAFLNEAAAAMLRLNGAAAVGQPLYELVRHRQFAELVVRALSRSEPQFGEVEWALPQPRVFAVHATRLPGTPRPGAVLVLDDITELRKLERHRQEFVANVSHELKTPLAAIQATVETLLDGAVNDPGHNVRFLQRVHENALRLNQLVQDLLTLGRIESGEEPLDIEPVDLRRAIEECVSRFEQRARGKQLKLEAVPPAGSVVIAADPEAVAHILDNLVDNAIKYTPANGTVAVRWYESGDDGVLEVIDTGVGIPEKDLTRVFERFYRVDRARSRELGGTGLGLSIVKHLAQALGGGVTVASTVGQGSKFAVRVPRSRQSHVALARKSSETSLLGTASSGGGENPPKTN